jgi:hypothetical protein
MVFPYLAVPGTLREECPGSSETDTEVITTMHTN